jgi:adenylate cyclase class IV
MPYKKADLLAPFARAMTTDTYLQAKSIELKETEALLRRRRDGRKLLTYLM